MKRWKGKASKMVNRPNEKDQIYIIIKNLLPTYNSRLLSLPISSFGELCDRRTRIEDAINNGERREQTFNQENIWGRIIQCQSNQPHECECHHTPIIATYQNFTKKVCREFSNLGMTLAQAYE